MDRLATGMGANLSNNQHGVDSRVQKKLSITKAIRPLIGRGFAEEVDAKIANSVWREEGERKLAIVITDAGRAAIHIADGKAPDEAPSADPPATLPPYEARSNSGGFAAVRLGATCRPNTWNTVYRRFRRWSEAGAWETVAVTLAEIMADSGHYSIDSTTVRAHVSAAGGIEPENRGRGRRPEQNRAIIMAASPSERAIPLR